MLTPTLCRFPSKLFIEREGIEDFPHLNLHESGQWHVKLKRKYAVQLQLHVGIVP
ncbi:MAG: hypothetical protein ACREX8_13330 [Gammaproteobacteria bacterium]